WLKVNFDLANRLETLRIAGETKLDPDAVVGKLIRIWQWAQQQTGDGRVLGATADMLDRVIGVAGFALAMKLVGWLEIDAKGVSFPRWELHNSNGAKER